MDLHLLEGHPIVGVDGQATVQEAPRVWSRDGRRFSAFAGVCGTAGLRPTVRQVVPDHLLVLEKRKGLKLLIVEHLIEDHAQLPDGGGSSRVPAVVGELWGDVLRRSYGAAVRPGASRVTRRKQRSSHPGRRDTPTAW